MYDSRHCALRAIYRGKKKTEETQLHVLQPRTVDTLYVAVYFRSTGGNCAITISPQGIERVHTYSIGYIRFMIAPVRVHDRRYMFYVEIVRAQEKFHFSATGRRAKTCGRDEKFHDTISRRD